MTLQDEKFMSKQWEKWVLDNKSLKYKCHWEKTPANIPEDIFQELNRRRRILYNMKLIWIYPNNIWYGNVSIRKPGTNQFYISGTSTGRLTELTPEHYCLVSKVEAKDNQLYCEGPIEASAESMTHSAVYESDSTVNAVIHIHNFSTRSTYMDKVPTTNKSVPYGTPEMSAEAARMFRETNVKETKFFVMGGHEDGVMSFGKSMDEAGRMIVKYFSQIENPTYACDGKHQD